MNTKLELVDAVIKLHDVARLVENEIGTGDLSDDIRKCADKLHVLALGVRIAENKSKATLEKVKE
jgi:hypothetical protein